MFMNITTVWVIMFLIKIKPLTTNYLNGIEIFNEVILYGCTGLIWSMTDYEIDAPPGMT
jgi:hypothetical protein